MIRFAVEYVPRHQSREGIHEVLREVWKCGNQQFSCGSKQGTMEIFSYIRMLMGTS